MRGSDQGVILPDLADPERALAVAYAAKDRRAALTTLFALDERFGQIVTATTEPMIGIMRLTWWREALERLDADASPAEPLLKAIAAHVPPDQFPALSLIEDGWAALLDSEDDQDVVTRHAKERGGNLFKAAASLLGADDDRLATAGEIWALADLGFRHSSASLRAAALSRAASLADRLPARRWPASARPLAMLAILASQDARRGSRAIGSPARLLRMLALRLTGR